MASDAAKTAAETRLAINCIAGTAYMVLAAFKTFRHAGFNAQWKAAVQGLGVVTIKFCPGDPGAAEEVMQRLAEAVKSEGSPAINDWH